MDSNSPSTMYKIEPLYDFKPKIDLPTCMYNVESIYRNTVALQQPSGDLTFEEIEKNQLEIIARLENLQAKVIDFKKELNLDARDLKYETLCEKPEKPQDIVINANPQYPPYSLWVFQHLLAKTLRVQLATYTHSSLDAIPDNIKKLNSPKDNSSFDLTFTVIWKKLDGKNPEMMLDPIHQSIIEGEVNIARYLSRLLNPKYDDPFIGGQIDRWLETAHAAFYHGSDKEQNAALKSINAELGKRNYLVGNSFSTADIILWSVIRQLNLQQTLPANVAKWWKNLNLFMEFQLPG